ncbi:MAG: SH3 domain-containing protein [Clostridiales bacterium]|nr:SH3 domain-containing protein [Clostridiales bacterium]
MAIKKNVEPVEEVVEEKKPVYKVYKNKVLLNFRNRPSMKGDVLKVLPVGTEIKVEKIVKNWAKCTVDDEEGYVMEQYIVAE